MKCRNCGNTDLLPFIDLGHAPYSNAYLTKEQLKQPEIYYPLNINVCKVCLLVQTVDFINPSNLFTNTYAYFSSTSSTFVEHAKNFVLNKTKMLNLNKNSFVVEIASNDGYLLQHFTKLQIPCLGIEPTESTANVSRSKDIPTIQDFFSFKISNLIKNEFGLADLIIANNVFAHVPNIHDFCAGLKNILSENGIISIEFPHILNLIRFNQFDTIYHEHYSYFSLNSVINILENHDLEIVDVEQISTHGGSLRVSISHKKILNSNLNPNIEKVLALEKKFNLNVISGYSKFEKSIKLLANNILNFLMTLSIESKNIYGYGAAAKANTILNFCKVPNDIIKGIFDSALAKQGKFMPGNHIPILDSTNIQLHNIENLIIFPWNIVEEIKFEIIKKNLNPAIYTLIPDVKRI